MMLEEAQLVKLDLAPVAQGVSTAHVQNSFDVEAVDSRRRRQLCRRLCRRLGLTPTALASPTLRALIAGAEHSCRAALHAADGSTIPKSGPSRFSVAKQTFAIVV